MNTNKGTRMNILAVYIDDYTVVLINPETDKYTVTNIKNYFTPRKPTTDMFRTSEDGISYIPANSEEFVAHLKQEFNTSNPIILPYEELPEAHPELFI